VLPGGVDFVFNPRSAYCLTLENNERRSKNQKENDRNRLAL
jgi:hypothetical protein